MVRQGGRALLGLIVAALLLALPAAAAEPVYTIGIVPQFDQAKTFAVWRPIVAELERRSGARLRLVSAVSLPEFERAFAAAAFDLVYCNPYHLTRLGEQGPYLPLARDQEPLHGIIVVRKDSPLQSPGELAGRSLAVPSANSMAASLVLQAELARLGVRVKPVEMKTHSAVYAAVVQHQAEAGGGADKTLAEQDPGVRDALRVLHVSTPLPSHPLAAHRRMPQAVREAVAAALLAMAEDETGRTLLAAVPMTRPVPATLAEYLALDQGMDAFWREPRN